MSAEAYKKKNLIGFPDAATRSSYIFTTWKRPAHPAWITRQVGEADGEVNVRQIGNFAGAEEPFAELFNELLQRSEQLRDRRAAQPRAVAALITAPRKLRP